MNVYARLLSRLFLSIIAISRVMKVHLLMNFTCFDLNQRLSIFSSSEGG